MMGTSLPSGKSFLFLRALGWELSGPVSLPASPSWWASSAENSLAKLQMLQPLEVLSSSPFLCGGHLPYSASVSKPKTIHVVAILKPQFSCWRTRLREVEWGSCGLPELGLQLRELNLFFLC